MPDSNDTDPTAALHEEGAEQLVEFVEQLQAMVDSSEQRVEELERRVRNLLDDRETLRQRVAEARQELSGLRSSVLGRIAARFAVVPSAKSTGLTARGVSSVVEHQPVSADSKLRVATIMDQISDACWSPEFANTRLSRHTWREQIEKSDPELLFVESAFAGVDGSWSKRVAHFGQPHADLVELVDACVSRGIPTVFWNKEDPVNFGWFIGAASLFDRVFTVDADQIPRYRRDLGHTAIDVLSFAAQPTLHFPPAEDGTRQGDVGFAGSYYARKHAERRTQMDMLLKPAIPFGLEIYDRMGDSPDPRFRWPDTFLPSIVGSVPYVEMGAIYRRYKAFLNVNTVTQSPTMCARRVFELAASDTPIVSGPSRAMEIMVPEGVAHIAHDESEVATALRSILTRDSGECTGAGPAWIASGHTYADRLSVILR